MRLSLKSGIVALGLCAGAASAAVLPPLAENARVRGEFLAAAIGDEIRKNCPTISARLFRVLGRVSDLEDYALEQGYTKADIKAMRDDADAKARLKEMRDAYLLDHGVATGDADSYCRLGHDEIARKSLTGWLLRAR